MLLSSSLTSFPLYVISVLAAVSCFKVLEQNRKAEMRWKWEQNEVENVFGFVVGNIGNDFSFVTTPHIFTQC